MVGVKCPNSGRVLAALALSVLAIFVAPQPGRAANPVEEFRQVYKAYEQELKSRHYAAAITYAEQALSMARESGAFGDDFIFTLTANLGKTYFLVGRWAQAARAFDQYLAGHPQPGASLNEYLAVLVQAGTAKRELRRYRSALPLFQRALEYLPRRDRELRPIRADALNQLTLVLMELKQADKALESGGEAWKLYDDLYGPKDVRTLETGLTLARAEVFLLKGDRANDHLKRVAKSLRENSDLRDWQKSGMHGRIAALYEKMDDKHEATRHREMADAFLRGLGDVELELKSSPPPEYPSRARANGTAGNVEVEYTVLRNGQLDDIHIIRSSPRGVFDAAVIKALRKWRYKPPKKNGERIDFYGVHKEFKFRVED